MASSNADETEVEMLVLAIVTLGWVWLLRPSAPPGLRPTKASSEEIWAALDKPRAAEPR